MDLEVDDTLGEFAPWEVSLARRQRAAHAAATRAQALPAYRKAWNGAGLADGPVSQENWLALPFLSKDELIESAASDLPFGGRLAVPPADLAQIFVAPGPLYMPFTATDMVHVAGSFAKALSSCGIEASDIVDQTTMYNWVIAATVIDQALRIVGCAVVPGGIGQSERHIEVIRDLGVTAIVAFPTFLEHLMELAAAGDTALPLRKAVVMGELSHPGTKRRLHAEHGITVREFYGTADVGAVAWECTIGEGMHLRDDLLVEFILPGGDMPVVPDRDHPAELVVTDFHRRAMPIIRLRTGDLVDGLVTAPCRCGRTAPRIGRIVGRASEITKVKGMFVVPRQVQDILRRHGVEKPFRLLVDRADGAQDRLTLELDAGASGRLPLLRADVESALRMRIEVTLVEGLPPDGPRLVDRRLQSPRNHPC